VSRAERDCAERFLARCPHPTLDDVQALLVEHREALLKPVDDLRRDFEAMRDERAVRWVDDVLKTARGIP